ncbi:MAG: hypothetical protein AB7P76_04755 [Candidatus Melainabacteria bacterium]
MIPTRPLACLMSCLLLTAAAMALTANIAPLCAKTRVGKVFIHHIQRPLPPDGCAINLADGVIFQTVPSGSWMNLNGRDTLLKPMALDEHKTVYAAWGIEVEVDFGKPVDQGDNKLVYDDARLKITRGDFSRVVKARGECDLDAAT